MICISYQKHVVVIVQKSARNATEWWLHTVLFPIQGQTGIQLNIHQSIPQTEINSVGIQRLKEVR